MNSSWLGMQRCSHLLLTSKPCVTLHTGPWTLLTCRNALTMVDLDLRRKLVQLARGLAHRTRGPSYISASPRRFSFSSLTSIEPSAVPGPQSSICRRFAGLGSLSCPMPASKRLLPRQVLSNHALPSNTNTNTGPRPDPSITIDMHMYKPILSPFDLDRAAGSCSLLPIPPPSPYTVRCLSSCVPRARCYYYCYIRPSLASSAPN